VQCCTVIPDRNAMSRHISAPPAATECSDYSASSIAAAAGEFQIALPAFDRPLQSSREGVEHSINKNMHVTGVQAGIDRRECTVSMLALRAFPYELKYETADDKRSSCRKHRASASADTLTFARSGSCDKLRGARCPMPARGAGGREGKQSCIILYWMRCSRGTVWQLYCSTVR